MEQETVSAMGGLFVHALGKVQEGDAGGLSMVRMLDTAVWHVGDYHVPHPGA